MLAGVLPGNANSSRMAVSCKKANGAAFSEAADYEVLVSC
jgi:hypothetical protein